MASQPPAIMPGFWASAAGEKSAPETPLSGYSAKPIAHTIVVTRKVPPAKASKGRASGCKGGAAVVVMETP